MGNALINCSFIFLSLDNPKNGDLTKRRGERYSGSAIEATRWWRRWWKKVNQRAGGKKKEKERKGKLKGKGGGWKRGSGRVEKGRERE